MFLDGTEAIQKMTIGAGLKVELFASEKEFPELVNPVQMAFDTRGRLWVAAWKNYPHWQPKDARDDKLLILEDTDGDGKADKRTVFAGDLNNPTGFEFYNNGVIVAQSPNVVFLKDTNGDDKYDVKEYLLHGFDSADTHHTINSFTFDPGGALYMQEGIFHRTQVETPWAPTMRQADGGVFRFEPRTWKVEVYIPMNFPNPHGHVFDQWGRDIVFDATGGQPYYGPSFSTKKYYPAMETKDAPKPGPVRTRPVGGTELISSRHFPESMQGNMVVLNTIGFRGLLDYKLSEDGAGLKSTEVEPILQSADENFRPVDAEIGPDGALYFLDWHNPLIGHMQHNLRDTSRDHEHGRVYRVTYPGRPLLKPAKIAGQPIPHLLDLLKEPEDRVRYRTKIELSGRDPREVLTALQAWIAQAGPEGRPNYEHHMMEALWVQQWFNRVDDKLLRRMLRSSEPWARAASTRVLCYWRDRIENPLALLKVQANDEHPAVRLEAVRAASFFQSAEAAAVALATVDHPAGSLPAIHARPDDEDVEAVHPLMPGLLTSALLSLFSAHAGPGGVRHLLRIIAHPQAPPAQEPPPSILLDQSPKAVEYQISRLTNDELARVERQPGDPKYRPIYAALLTRKGLARPLRDEAIAALTKLDNASTTQVLLQALSGMRVDADEPTANQLLDILLAQSPETLRSQRDAFATARNGGQPFVLRGRLCGRR